MGCNLAHGMRRRLLELLVALAGLLVVRRVLGPHMWRIRLVAARLFHRVPNRLLPKPLRVMAPPRTEFVGVWPVAPDTAREQLRAVGFRQLFRAYLHAHDREGMTVYEVSSCAYRAEGTTSRWQLHVRLFPTPEGNTEVWAHRELNPNVAPIAHLKREGYDPEGGRQEVRELLPEGTLTQKSPSASCDSR